MIELDEHELRLAAEALKEKADRLEQQGKKWEARKYQTAADKIMRIVDQREATWIKNRFREVTA